ncbi:helix-turn-helix transcriptional regulator [Planomonospora sp. ID67723]|uniref:helix-turn-helix domain-containing protein n=1 Tax=Planomonospora sp. ID67723 TaxID=2738134 RepID=UPI0018C394CF|nr:helix-turn-helix transcriptional regulator [Planomonospora sp. ID67723]MBG0828508.1 helix-turn-helix transcriptional regulator [Planomonospora sp. ID67723]
MKPVTVQLADARRDRDLHELDITAALGIADRSLYRWETGRCSPKVRSVIAWAGVLGYRAVVSRHEHVAGGLLDVVMRLPELRRAAGLTQSRMGERLFIHQVVVSRIERTAGPGMWLATADRYLTALGHEITLKPIDALERVA